jgi:hypothetical protein
MQAVLRRLSGLLVAVLLVVGVAAASGRLNELLPLDLPTPPAAQTSAPARLVAAADEDVNAAIQQVIQRSNDEQVQAIAARDSSLMAGAVTSDHFKELVQINQSLLDNGVTSIRLVRLDWGPVTIDGSTATATTYETWTTTLADGTTSRSRDRNDYGLVLDNGAWKIATDAHPDQAPQANAPPPAPLLPFPGGADNPNVSHNWSGYAATGGTYTAVSGTWTVPQFKSSESSFGIDATWVGIGGVRTRDLIQAGTQQTVTGNSRTRYEAWVETLPRASRPVALRIYPGDSITVSITEQSANVWLIDFTNNTTGQTLQQTEQYTSSHSSAEWVEEAPSGGRGGLLPLDNFGKVEFNNGSAVKDGTTVSIAGANAHAITMVGPNDQALAVPSVLGADGTSFSVARTDVPAPAATPRSRGPVQPAPTGGS